MISPLPQGQRFSRVYIDRGEPSQDSVRMRRRIRRGGKDWVDAAHFFRQEQGMADEVAQPPLGLAVHIFSTGAAHLRWLAELDALLPTQETPAKA